MTLSAVFAGKPAKGSSSHLRAGVEVQQLEAAQHAGGREHVHHGNDLQGPQPELGLVAARGAPVPARRASLSVHEDRAGADAEPSG